VEEVEAGKYDAEIEELMKASKEDLRQRYGDRDIEK
jgi:hypothetical protein